MCTGSHPFIPVPHTVRVEQRYVALGQQLESVFHATGTADAVASDCETIAAVTDAWYADTLKAVLSEDLTYVETRATAIHVENGPFAIVATSAGDPGEFAEDALPLNATFAIHFGTGLSGRSFQGRVYVPTLVATQMLSGNANQLDPTAITAVVNAYKDLGSRLTTVGFPQSIVSYCGGGAWRTTGLATPVTSVTSTDPYTDSQRRRLTGRGR